MPLSQAVRAPAQRRAQVYEKTAAACRAGRQNGGAATNPCRPALIEEVDFQLDEVEVRVLGALMEKEATTPEYYPLSLNALVNACNQKSNRDPVMSLDEDTVRTALYNLRNKGLAATASGLDSRVAKYEHRLAEVFHFTRGGE